MFSSTSGRRTVYSSLQCTVSQYRLTHGPEKSTSATSSLSTHAHRNTHRHQLGRKIGENGNLAMIQWLYARKRLRFSVHLSAGAAKGGHLDLLKWLRANGCPWDWAICHMAAEGGHLEVLKWVRANGCDWHSWTCADAAKGGHLEVLKLSRANGCDWDWETCAGAAEGGHLEVLKWARANGCDWNSFTCSSAASRGNGQERMVATGREKDVGQQPKKQGIMKWHNGLRQPLTRKANSPNPIRVCLGNFMGNKRTWIHKWTCIENTLVD